jgi:hypothetical protein
MEPILNAPKRRRVFAPRAPWDVQTRYKN